MFAPMLLCNEPKLMMLPPSSTSSARSSIAFPPRASKATLSLCPPKASRTCCFQLLSLLNKPEGQKEPIGAFRQIHSTAPAEWGGHRDPKQLGSANARHQMPPHS